MAFLVKFLSAILSDIFLNFEGVVAPCCNTLTLQPEQSGGWGSHPIITLERHDKGSRTRLAHSYFCDPATSPSP